MSAKTATKSPIATVTLTFVKETPGTYQFKDATAGSPIPVLYVKKDHFDSQPAQITVTVV